MKYSFSSDKFKNNYAKTHYNYYIASIICIVLILIVMVIVRCFFYEETLLSILNVLLIVFLFNIVLVVPIDFLIVSGMKKKLSFVDFYSDHSGVSYTIINEEKKTLEQYVIKKVSSCRVEKFRIDVMGEIEFIKRGKKMILKSFSIPRYYDNEEELINLLNRYSYLYNKYRR